MKIAVIDLGTNTFNLIITKVSGNSHKIILNLKRAVKLGEGGINKQIISEAAFERGVKAIENYHRIIQENQCNKVFAFATSAMRTASNGNDFINTIEENFKLKIETISGDREAELIYYGVKQAVDLTNNPVLILDIGGGSNEFIIANNQEIFWKNSFPLGIARLLEKFNPNDPITPKEIELVNQYLDKELELLFNELSKYSIKTLVGASGSFETFVLMYLAQDKESETSTEPDSFVLNYDSFISLYNKLIQSTLEERKQMKGLELMRVEMIVLATIFVKFVLQKTGIKKIIQSNFSLKEGIIYELINKA